VIYLTTIFFIIFRGGEPLLGAAVSLLPYLHRIYQQLYFSKSASFISLTMHLYRFILLALSISSAAANGVRAGYERVWLWYAYQIDLTLPVDQRKIGFRCIQFTQAGQACNPTYQRMSRGMSFNFMPHFHTHTD
jgi:hypothetical protein